MTERFFRGYNFEGIEEINRELPEEFDLSERNITIPEEVLQPVKSKQDADISEFLVGTPKLTEEDITPLPYQTKIYSLYPGNAYLYFQGVTDPKHPHADLQIARLEFDPDSGRVIRLTRNVSSDIFRAILANFPENSFWGQLRKILNIPNPSAEDITEKEKLIRESREIESIVKELSALSSEEIFSGTLIENENNTRQIHNVNQGEYSIAEGDKIGYLATYGASACIILAIYNPINKKGGLAHIDGFTDEVLTARIMRRGIGPGTHLKITILGGTSASTRQIVDLYKEILSWKQEGSDVGIRIGPIFRGLSQSLALNLSTGETQEFVINPSLHPKAESVPIAFGRVAVMYQQGRKQVAKFSPPSVSEE